MENKTKTRYESSSDKESYKKKNVSIISNLKFFIYHIDIITNKFKK